ncbi:UNVERIFIED_CONTAM: AAR2 protein [Hammondia hammondi]|eukprot:XP_008883502.1 AAR2 protein [Hammondia hammondi]
MDTPASSSASSSSFSSASLPAFSGGRASAHALPETSSLPPFLSPEDAASQLGSCSLLLLNLPVGPSGSSVHVGLDYALWRVGPHFSGVKCIQPGCHLLYTLADASSPAAASLKKSTGETRGGGSAFECMYTSMRVEEAIGGCKDGIGSVQSEFLFLQPHAVCVRRWNPRLARLEKLKDEDEEERFVRAVRRLELDRKLGVYPQQYVRMWSVLTDFISAACLERIEPVKGLFASLPQDITKEEAALLGDANVADASPGNALRDAANSEGHFRKKVTRTHSTRARDDVSVDGEGEEEDHEEHGEQRGEVTSSGKTPVARFFFSEVPSLRATAVAAARRAETEARRQGATAVAAKALGAQALTRAAVDPSLGLLMVLQDLQKVVTRREGRQPEKPSQHVKKDDETGTQRREHGGKEEDGEAVVDLREGEPLLAARDSEEAREKREWRTIERRTWENLLGEIQLAYLAFLLGHRFDGFEQWKQLLLLLCHCERAVHFLPEMYVSFLRLLHCQLEQCPDDLLSDALLQKSFLFSSASALVDICLNSPAGPLSSCEKGANVKLSDGAIQTPEQRAQREQEREQEEVMKKVCERARWLQQLLRQTFKMREGEDEEEFERKREAAVDDLGLLDEEDGPVVVDREELRRAGCLTKET